ncbi:TPA: type II secretion system protein GspL [Escherichia coli]
MSSILEIFFPLCDSDTVRWQRRTPDVEHGIWPDVADERLQQWLQTDAIRLYIPGEWISVWQVELPDVARKQIPTILPALLEEELNQDIDELHFAPLKIDQQLATVAVIHQQHMRNIAQWLQANGITRATVAPDWMSIPCGYMAGDAQRVICRIDECRGWSAGRALALTDDRGTESLAGYLRTLTDGQLLAIKTLSMDMNAGYIRAARIHLPCAVEKIAFDRFHVAKQLGEVVDKTRQNEHPHLPVESWRQAKGTRFLWQYSDKWMTKSRQEKLIWLRAQMKLTSQCWALKELAKDIWNRPWSEERRNDWERWLALAANSDVPMMKNAAKTIGKRLYGILNAMRHRVSNGNAEALNSKIRLLRIKARGYRNRERFKLGVMFHYGKLNMAF